MEFEAQDWNFIFAGAAMALAFVVIDPEIKLARLFVATMAAIGAVHLVLKGYGLF